MDGVPFAKCSLRLLGSVNIAADSGMLLTVDQDSRLVTSLVEVLRQIQH